MRPFPGLALILPSEVLLYPARMLIVLCCWVAAEIKKKHHTTSITWALMEDLTHFCWLSFENISTSFILFSEKKKKIALSQGIFRQDLWQNFLSTCSSSLKVRIVSQKPRRPAWPYVWCWIHLFTLITWNANKETTHTHRLNPPQVKQLRVYACIFFFSDVPFVTVKYFPVVPQRSGRLIRHPKSHAIFNSYCQTSEADWSR